MKSTKQGDRSGARHNINWICGQQLKYNGALVRITEFHFNVRGSYGCHKLFHHDYKIKRY